jgi:hypothetical protein
MDRPRVHKVEKNTDVKQFLVVVGLNLFTGGVVVTIQRNTHVWNR